MLASGRPTPCRNRFRLGHVLLVAGPCLLAGCGGDNSPQPAPVDQAQMKKAQEYLGNYREQIIAANKEKAKHKGKAAEKKP